MLENLLDLWQIPARKKVQGGGSRGERFFPLSRDPSNPERRENPVQLRVTVGIATMAGMRPTPLQLPEVFVNRVHPTGETSQTVPP